MLGAILRCLQNTARTVKVDRELFTDIKDEAGAPVDTNPQKFYRGLYEKREVERICEAVNEDFETSGLSMRVFPRRVGDGVVDIFDSTRDPELPVEALSGDGFEEIECASGIMESGEHLFELWKVDMDGLPLSRERLFHACAEGFQDIFDNTYLEDVFYAGL
jgi:hypothetical protein